MLQVWVIGKWATPNDQKWAPPRTHFHQFVVPNIIESRQDCTYGKLAAMHLPKEIKGLRSCEVLVLKYLLIYNLLTKGIVGATFTQHRLKKTFTQQPPISPIDTSE
jgi:hypothetical protein